MYDNSIAITAIFQAVSAIYFSQAGLKKLGFVFYLFAALCFTIHVVINIMESYTC